MLKDIFAFIGLACLIGVTGTLLVVLWGEFWNWIDRLKYRYEIKHRFDKPPTAKCYCRDCVRHDSKTNRCYKFDGWYTAPSWFCWDADPRKEDNHEED